MGSTGNLPVTPKQLIRLKNLGCTLDGLILSLLQSCKAFSITMSLVDPLMLQDWKKALADSFDHFPTRTPKYPLATD
tara:strand:+ start:297 stop:527 length:231 start_codon:yes stop_codon:yes gene_type:complete